MHKSGRVPSFRNVFTLLGLTLALLGASRCSDDESESLGDSGSSSTADGSVTTIDGGVSSMDAATADGGTSRVDAGADAAVGSGRLYVTIAGTNELWVIDEQTHAVLKKIPVGVGPAIVVGTPSRDKLYTANWTDNTVSAVNPATGSAKSIPLVGRPYVIAISADGKYVYAGLTAAANAKNTIAVIDTETDTVERSLEVPALAASIIVSPDGTTLYVAEVPLDGKPGTLRAISAATGDVLKPAVAVGLAPAWITITPDGSKVYTLNYNSDDVAVVDTQTFGVTKIDTGKGSKGIIGNVTPDGSRLYVTNLGTGELIGIDTKTSAIVQTIKLDGRPVGIQFNRAGTRLYVTDYGLGSLDAPTSDGQGFLLTGKFTPRRPGQVSVFDRATGNRVGDKITVEAGPTSIVADAP